MAATAKAVKVYLKVSVVFDEDGQMLPRALEWEDGRKYKIDRVLKKRPAHADKVGGQGDRYTVMINGHERHLFFEPSYDGDNLGRWFVERRL